jgi:hypothetical protein
VISHKQYMIAGHQKTTWPRRTRNDEQGAVLAGHQKCGWITHLCLIQPNLHQERNHFKKSLLKLIICFFPCCCILMYACCYFFVWSKVTIKEQINRKTSNVTIYLRVLFAIRISNVVAFFSEGYTLYSLDM